MALVLADRVQETSTTTGTGTLTLAGAVIGFQSFAVVGDGNTTYYAITSGAGDWEVGIGTYTSAGTTLSRTTVLSSSNAGSLVSFTGTLNVFVTYPSSKSVYGNSTTIVAPTGAFLPVVSGGTGLTSVTANRIPYGNGTSALNTSANLTFDGTTLTNTGNTIISDNSANAALRITQVGTGNALLVEDSANPDATPFVVDASGKVAIGATTATENLNLVSDGRNFLQLTRASTDSNQSVVSYRKARGTNASPTVVASGDAIGDLQYFGYDGASYIQAASILSSVDGTPGTNDMPGRLVFFTTADGASSPTERMRIGNAGSVGIGGYAAQINLYNTKNITGATFSYAFSATNSVQSDVTNTAAGYHTTLSTQATAFTVSSLNHYWANQGTIGLGSTVTNQFGFNAAASLTGATNNYGFYGNIASGTGRWNFYAAGTAANYLAGGVIINNNLGVGAAGSPSYGTSGQVLTSAGAGAAPTWATPVSSNITAQGLYENNATISANYTIGTGNNAVSAGPITINSSIVVTVPSGSTWVVV